MCFEWKLQNKFTLGKQMMVEIKSTPHKDNANEVIVPSLCIRLPPTVLLFKGAPCNWITSAVMSPPVFEFIEREGEFSD